MKQFYRAHRGRIVMSLCAAALALLALLPAGALQLTDALRLGRVQTIDALYTPRALTADDFYLLRQLTRRETLLDSTLNLIYDPMNSRPAASGSDTTLTVTGAFSPADEAMVQYALTRLQTLADAGVLPAAWAEGFAAYTQNVLDYYGLDSSFSYAADSLGFVTIRACAPLDGAAGRGDPLLYMTVESRTGQVVGLWLALPVDLAPEDVTLDAAAWLRLLGLDALTDWAAPADTFYEENGLYSPAAGVLATWQVYRPDAKVPYVHALSLHLSMPAQLPLLNTPGQPAETEAGIIRPVAAWVNNDVEPETYPYGLAECETGFVVMNLEQNAPVCARPGCAHIDESCPAWLPYQRGVTLFTAGERLYVMHAWNMDDETRAFYAQEAVNAASQHLAASLLEPDYLDVFLPDGSRQRVAELPPEVYFAWADDGALYGLEMGANAWWGVNMEQVTALVQLNLGDGTLTYTQPEQLALLRQAYDRMLIWNGQLLLQVMTLAEPYMQYTGLYDSFDAVQALLLEHARQLCFAWDPRTGATRLLVSQTWSDSISYMLDAMEGDTVYLYVDGRGEGLGIWRETLDLRTGERQVVEVLLSPEVERLMVTK